jgi:hypothetical protein
MMPMSAPVCTNCVVWAVFSRKTSLSYNLFQRPTAIIRRVGSFKSFRLILLAPRTGLHKRRGADGLERGLRDGDTYRAQVCAADSAPRSASSRGENHIARATRGQSGKSLPSSPNFSAAACIDRPTNWSCSAASRSNVRQRIHLGLLPLLFGCLAPSLGGLGACPRALLRGRTHLRVRWGRRADSSADRRRCRRRRGLPRAVHSRRPGRRTRRVNRRGCMACARCASSSTHTFLGWSSRRVLGQRACPPRRRSCRDIR